MRYELTTCLYDLMHVILFALNLKSNRYKKMNKLIAMLGVLA